MKNELDVLLGARIRARRKELKISQSVLANEIGVTFQQVQKYELGANRVSFSRLCEIAKSLACSVSQLIEGIDCNTDCDGGILTQAQKDLAAPNAAEMLRAFSQIKSGASRWAIINMCKSFLNDKTEGNKNENTF